MSRPPTPLGAVPLTYVVKDSDGNTSTGSVVVHVLPVDATNHPPQPPDVTARVYENRGVTVQLPLLGIDPDGDVTTLVAVAPPTLGGQVLGSIDVAARARSLHLRRRADGGTQQLTYQVRDSGGLLASGAIHIGVVAPPAQNSPPVALPDTVASPRARSAASPCWPTTATPTVTRSRSTRRADPAHAGGTAAVDGGYPRRHGPGGRSGRDEGVLRLRHRRRARRHGSLDGDRDRDRASRRCTAGRRRRPRRHRSGPGAR